MMLFGGRPLPERSLTVRLLIIGVVLFAAWPIVTSAFAALSDRFAKMPANEVEAALDKHPLWGATPAPARNTRCERSTGNWDYVCTFVYATARGASTPKRMKVGVRVGSGKITRVSPPHDLSAKHIRQ